MKWNSVKNDFLPDDQQTVLISVRGVYYVSIFDAENKTFTVRDNPEIFFEAGAEEIYWVNFIDGGPGLAV